MRHASIIIGILSSALALSACSTNKTPATTDRPQTSQATDQPGTPVSPLTPTPEQQKAAQELLNQTENAGPPPVTPAGDAAQQPSGTVPQTQGDQTGIPPIVPEPVILNPAPTDSLPVNLRGIRNPVPLEETASSSSNAAPAPNAVELRGLRSPSMPKTLPMDITGRQTTGNAQ